MADAATAGEAAPATPARVAARDWIVAALCLGACAGGIFLQAQGGASVSVAAGLVIVGAALALWLVRSAEVRRSLAGMCVIAGVVCGMAFDAEPALFGALVSMAVIAIHRIMWAIRR